MFSTSLSLPKQSGKRPRRPAPLPAGAVLLLCFVLSLAAILARSPTALAWLSLAEGALLVCYRCDRRTLRRGLRLGLWQGGVITLLYVLRYGPADGLLPGLRISWQLALIFLPGLVLFSGESAGRLAQALGKVLPARSAFVLAASLKFLPLLLAEIAAIHEAQLLRGARLRPRELVNPRNWGDLLHCLVAPAVVRALELADNIACAARAREFGRLPRRTCWPGDTESSS